MAVLIIGGAGYIGSHAVQFFKKHGEEVVVVDNLLTGHKASVDVEHFYEFDIREKDKLDKVFKTHDIDGVIHFAASSLVGESMTKPSLYFNNNVYGMICLLDVMNANDVKNIVFSSSAATYGEPVSKIIKETDPTVPKSPYGESKLMMEKIMKWYDQAYGIKYVSLRYFNAAGASKDSSIGEAHTTETHLIPLILQVPLGQRENIFVFGDDYDTRDGSCIRDYIHVLDLADAHLKALNYLRKSNPSEIFNLGTGDGYSVLEVIKAAEKVVGKEINTVISERRAGDPAILVASNKKAKEVLNWTPIHSNIEEILKDAWNYHVKNPNGYEA